jgi:hypothetical protein
MIVTDGGGAASFGVTGTVEAGGAAVAGAFSLEAEGGASAARDIATVNPATIATLRDNHPALRMNPPRRRR